MIFLYEVQMNLPYVPHGVVGFSYLDVFLLIFGYFSNRVLFHCLFWASRAIRLWPAIWLGRHLPTPGASRA